MKFITETRHAH